MTRLLLLTKMEEKKTPKKQNKTKQQCLPLETTTSKNIQNTVNDGLPNTGHQVMKKMILGHGNYLRLDLWLPQLTALSF